MSKYQNGVCALCGKPCKLTYEHIPPKAALNSKPVKMYTGIELLSKDSERMPWEVQGLQYVSQQKGSGKYSLCENCNNNTGSWYGDSYQEMVHIFAALLSNPEIKTAQGIGIKGIYPLRFFKQIISMFCSVNDHKSLIPYLHPKQVPDKEQQPPMVQMLVDVQEKMLEAAILMEELRSFVLDKNATGLDKKRFKVCMYLTESPLLKINGISSVMNINENTYAILSEITAPPFGFLLYFNPADNLIYQGVDITALGDLKYDDKANIEMPLCILEMNTYLPNDYRSKTEIKKTVEENERWSQKH